MSYAKANVKIPADANSPNHLLSTSQQSLVSVSGTVTDESGLALIGVNVLVKGVGKGVVTDFDGKYTIEDVEDNAVLVFSYVGFVSQEVAVDGRSVIDVTLVTDAETLEEIVVVGYGVQKKATVTGAVTATKGEELSKSPSVNLSNSLAGRLPGVTAIQSSGEPGYDGSTIRIRGSNTLGNSSALVVIDGVPDRAGGLERLNPADIESVSVLKDASAAIYGARAANGVILITTKRGSSGKPQLNYSFNQGVSQPTRIPDMANAVEYAEMNNELVLFDQIPADQWSNAWSAFKSDGVYTRTDNGAVINAPFSPEDILKHGSGSNPWTHPDEDYFGSVLKDWSPQSRHTLSISGGLDKLKYYASMGYQNQDAYYHNSATGYKQYDLNVNLDAEINDYINTTFGITAREENRFFPTQSAGAIFRMLMRGKPTEHVVYPNGLPGPDIENGQNPYVITTNATGYDDEKRDYFQTNGSVTIKIPGVEGLSFKGLAAVDKYIRRRKVWSTPWDLYFWDNTTYEADGVTPVLTSSTRSTFSDPRLTQQDESTLDVLLSGFVNYDRSFGNHELNFMAAVSKETKKGDNFNAFRRYFISETVDQLFAGGDAEKDNGGGAFERARLSYFGRVGYNYGSKYLAEFLWRYDGSYLFPENGRYGFFPGILLGWNISEEDFFKNNISAITNLKLRASYGQMGNDQVYYNNTLQEYKYLSTYGFGSYIIDQQVTKTLFETVVPNPDFTWELATNTNFGFDGELYNGMFDFTFEYFYNKRTNILWQASGSTPGSSGIANLLPPQNIGEVENRGYEFSVGYNKIKGEFNFNVGINAGYAKNKVLFADEAPGTPEYQRFTGHAFGSSGFNYLAYQYDGVFKDFNDIQNNELDYSGFTNELRPGDMKFKDVNNDGKLDADDKVRLDKNRDPRLTFGANFRMNYKNFDATVLMQGATGGLLYIGTESGDIGNYLKYSYDNRWTVDNPSSVDPRIANRNNTYYTGSGGGDNTYFLRSSDYVRIKNVEVGYTFTNDLIGKVGLTGLRLYVNALNLITFDEMKIWDPESTNSAGTFYPQARILNAGLTVQF
ncbi:SusC/RagA family TonB-linked outer membrane protein [Membranihabitans marinus]|uniref:SusC/RagA family TonB-linked outer membrane protein n=1 Tax=Membranihabitans marinus TaxID=1227546 RepID=UPI001F1A0EC7|nr:TonB-dependent receptor [Membranihabitans marinus]